MQDAIILGGGISGLTAAYLAQEKGLDVSVIEKASTPGGPISSYREDGYLFERGPNSLLLPNPWVETFIDELGLSSELLESNPEANKRYIVKGEKLVPVPASPIQGVTTPLFSFTGKLGFLLEPFRSKISEQTGSNETVASFVKRRMGKDFLDYAIDPFVSGVYAGDPSKLILEYAFPLMRGFEKDGGSIIRGAIRHKKRQKKEGTAYKKRSISFKSGLGILPQTISRKLGNRLWLDSEVIAVDREHGYWQVTWRREGENFNATAKNLLVCLPSHAIKKISWSKEIAATISSAPDLSFPCVHSLALGFRNDQIDHPLDGFGALVPSVEPQNILGVLFSSSLYEGRSPDGHCSLTVMIGGIRRPDMVNLSTEQLLEIALTDLRPLLGITGNPDFCQCTSWPRAIPQYTEEFGPWRETLRGLENKHPSLFFGGNSVDGIAMGASICSGKTLAEKLG